MTDSRPTRAYAFTDIVGSTETKRAVGDVEYKKILDEHHDRIRQFAEVVLNIVGDSFFMSFENAAKAVDACVKIQRSLRDSPILAKGKNLTVRIGIDIGDPILFQHPDGRWDVSGTIADQASRFESLAAGYQVVISNRVHVLAILHPHELPGIIFHDCGEYFLKGAGYSQAYEVLWDEKKPTALVGKAKSEAGPYRVPFVGRKDDLRGIRKLLKDPRHRLIVLQGQGGIGKTRLAREIQQHDVKQFTDGVFFAELEFAATAEAVESQVRQSCGAAEGQVEESLRNKSALLILNNWESAVKGRNFIAGLLGACGRLKVLATSQVPMKIPGEQTWPVNPMSREDAESLFLAYATRHAPGFKIADSDRKAFDNLLTVTDCVPFCLELAAAGVRPGASLKWVVDGLQESFNKLQPASVPEGRHRSVTACLDWSLNLVGDAERRLYPQLGVFQGGFVSDNVSKVCDEPGAAGVLAALYDASLLRFSGDRYYMLPTALEYARDKIGIDASSLRKRHAEHYLERLEEAASWIQGKKQHEGYTWLRAEFENCRAGIEWAIASNADALIVRYSHAFANRLATIGRAVEQLAFCQAGLQAAKRIGEKQGIASAQNDLGIAYRNLSSGDRAENLGMAIACYEAALRVRTERDYPLAWAATQNNLGIAYQDLPGGDRAENLGKAIACYEAALRVLTERDYPLDWAMTQNNLGTAYQELPSGDRAENLGKAIACYEAALRVWTERDYPLDWATTQNNLGNAYGDLPSGDRAENQGKAIACYEAALRVRTERDYPLAWATTQYNLGGAYRELPSGDRAENLVKAIACYKAALRVWTEQDNPLYWAMTQHGLAAVYERLAGNRKDNLRQAIPCLEAAIRGYRAVRMHEKADEVQVWLKQFQAQLANLD